METLLQMALSNAVVATLLAVVVAAIGLVCRRPALVHALWLLVLLKLVTPAPLMLPVSVPAWLELERGTPPALEPSPIVADSADRLTSAEEPAWTETARAALVSVSAWLADCWLQLVLTVWLAGAGLWFVLAGVRSYRFGARPWRRGRPASESLQDQAERLARDLGLAQCPRVWLVPGMLSPMLWGLGRRARLLLPANLIARLDGEQLRTVLAHELAHARRCDPWVRILELLVLGLYWWHPVAWWARRRLREAEEQCCDAWVVWALPAAAPSYATALVETVAFLSAARPALPPVASGISYVSVLKQRLTLILSTAPPKSASLGGLLGVLVLGLLLLPWRPAWGQPESETADSPALTQLIAEAPVVPRHEIIALAPPPPEAQTPIETPPPVIVSKAANESESSNKPAAESPAAQTPAPPDGPGKKATGPPPRKAGHPKSEMGPRHHGGPPHGGHGGPHGGPRFGPRDGPRDDRDGRGPPPFPPDRRPKGPGRGPR